MEGKRYRLTINGFPVEAEFPRREMEQVIDPLIDALLVLRHSMNIYQLNDDQLPHADMNGDGIINFDDAVLIIRNALDI